MKKPNPSSPEAQEQGCVCDPFDNEYGNGIITDKGAVVFIVSQECPLHGYEGQVPYKLKENTDG